MEGIGQGFRCQVNLVLSKSGTFACGCTDVRRLNTLCSRGSLGSLSVSVC